MNCFSCHLSFTQSNPPRVFKACGHTLCEDCLKPLLKLKKIPCPQCSIKTRGSSLKDFPVNLALFQVERPVLCEKHRKSIEGFCMNEMKPLCVTCILEDGHTSHDIQSISGAAGKLKENLVSYEKSIALNHDSLLKDQAKDSNSTEKLLTLYDLLLKEYKGLYQKLAEILKQREEEVLGDLYAHLQEELVHAKDRERTNNETLLSIEKFKKEVLVLEREPEIEIVVKFPARETAAQKAALKVKTYPRSPFKSYSKDNEITEILKRIRKEVSCSLVMEKEKISASKVTRSAQKAITALSKDRSEDTRVSRGSKKTPDQMRFEIERKLHKIELFSNK